MYKNSVKPVLDFFIATIALVLLLPVFLLTYGLLAIVQKGNPIFSQKRPGKGARIFTIYKFRTMTNETDANGNLLPDADRLTGFGKFVRSTSLDEIPQLLNVLLGDMSIVGPRPLLPSYLPLYSPEQRRRHEVRPGITGWAQVNGRNALSWKKKFEMDVFYTENISFLLDMEILYKTVLKVIRRNDISSTTSSTMEAFKGNEYEQ